MGIYQESHGVGSKNGSNTRLNKTGIGVICGGSLFTCYLWPAKQLEWGRYLELWTFFGLLSLLSSFHIQLKE